MEAHGTAAGAPPVYGTCGLCGRECGRSSKERFGRRVTSLEKPLQKVVEGFDVVCDDCLRTKQPLRRADKQWAKELRERAPLCARNGWCCPLQAHEGKKKHTETLRPDGLSAFLREQMGIRQYAAANSICLPCYKELSKKKTAEPRTPSTAVCGRWCPWRFSIKQHARARAFGRDLQ